MAEKMTKERASELMTQGFHCSQVVFEHAARLKGMDPMEARRISAGLGGGAFHGEMCGTVSGAVLGIGLFYGYDKPNAEAENELMIAKIREFHEKFIAKHGSIVCRELLLHGFDFANPTEDYPEDTFDNCSTYCADACAILEEVVAERL